MSMRHQMIALFLLCECIGSWRSYACCAILPGPDGCSCSEGLTRDAAAALGMGLIFFLSIKLLGFVKLGMLFAFVGTCAARTSLAKPKQLAEPKKDK